ncbi:unnamed protein product [Leptidea sinapis]|uniref:Uncharacterized protein n=1 Tax=Leptidea sinapis TaxID=189913 RepID=A0A5E4Q0I1_9NEOP|nr:unnamed protein product [Leptidea sinapis]
MTSLATSEVAGYQRWRRRGQVEGGLRKSWKVVELLEPPGTPQTSLAPCRLARSTALVVRVPRSLREYLYLLTVLLYTDLSDTKGV